MFFLNPTYLWALLGLLVPIAIHLWNKKEGSTIQIGSIQLLEESDAKQSKRIQWNEFLLLLFRLLILGVLVCILAVPQIKKHQKKSPITYIVEPSLLVNSGMKNILDTINENSEIRILQKGFPEINDQVMGKESNQPPKYWQLAKKMESLQTDSIVVFTKALWSGIKGKRPRSYKNINWMILPLETSSKKNIVAVSQKDTIVEVISLRSSDQHSIFEKRYIRQHDEELIRNEVGDSLVFRDNEPKEIFALTPEKPLRVQLFYTDSFSNEKNKIEAAYNALSKYLKRPIELNQTENPKDLEIDNFDLTIWLSTEIPPKSFPKLLQYLPNLYADQLITKSPLHHIFYLTNSLSTENIIEEHFAEQLLLLFDLHAKEELEIVDQRQLALEEFLPGTMAVKDKRSRLAVFDLSIWLWPLLAVLLIVERLMAKWRRQ